MPTRTEYPVARPRWRGAPPQLAQKFQRYESTTAEVTLGDNDADVISFSGRPDAISVTARTFGALVKLTDRLGRETSYIEIPTGQPVWLPISREKVIAKNLVAGSNAVIFVTGAWAEADERG
jgi:hypothetical protein